MKDAWVAIAARFRDAVLRLPSKLAPEVIAAADLREAHDIIEREVESMLHTLADDLVRGGFD